METPNFNNSNRIKPIGIEDFTRLVKDRLENPEAYSGQTLILWNGSDEKDGVANQVIEQSCVEYNKSNPDAQVWVRYSSGTFHKDNYSHYSQDWTCGNKTCRIIFNVGSFWKDRTPSFEDWLRFVTTHKNNCGQIPDDCSLIACVPADWNILRADQFPENCDIYSLQPSVEEWAQWAAPYFKKSKVFQPVLSFLTKKGNVTDFVIHKHTRKQTDFLYMGRLIENLDKRLEATNLQSIKELPKIVIEEEVNHAIGWRNNGFPIEEFWEFIQNGEWQS